MSATGRSSLFALSRLRLVGAKFSYAPEADIRALTKSRRSDRDQLKVRFRPLADVPATAQVCSSVGMIPTRKELFRDWPSNASDVEGATRLLRHDSAALEPVLADMVQWLKSNGPVRDMFVEHLAAQGSAASAAVGDALRGTHEGQIEVLLREVLPLWSRAQVIGLQVELEQLLQKGSLVGLNIHALALLQRAHARTHSPLSEWAELFRKRLDEQDQALDQIEAHLRSG